MTEQAPRNPAAWRPEGGFAASIATARQLQTFNDLASFAVNFDVMRSVKPAIQMVGSKSSAVCLWETRSASGFITKPRLDAAFITIRFVTNGHIAYRNRSHDAVGTPEFATLVGFDDINEVQASQAFSAVNGTILAETLLAANTALTGEQHGFPALAPIAKVDTPGMNALFCTLKQVQRWHRGANSEGDLVLPLIQEILGYQILSAWPRRTPAGAPQPQNVSVSRLQMALDYIEANLSSPLTLAAIAAAAGVSVRTLQDNFRKALGQTPIQYIIDQRLMRAHQDLTSTLNDKSKIADIAKRWGFVHLSDFGQRYKRMYGRTPTEARRDANPPRSITGGVSWSEP